MYIVAQKYQSKDGDQSLMSEKIHSSIDLALEDYNERITNGYRTLIIAKILTVKTVVIDFDGAEHFEIPIGGDLQS